MKVFNFPNSTFIRLPQTHFNTESYNKYYFHMRNIVWFIIESFVSKQKFLLRFNFYLYQQARACVSLFT